MPSRKRAQTTLPDVVTPDDTSDDTLAAKVVKLGGSAEDENEEASSVLTSRQKCS